MEEPPMPNRNRAAWSVAVPLAAALAAALPGGAALAQGADPAKPGWSKSPQAYFVGAGDRKWLQDYGVMDGRCNKQGAGAVAAMGSAEPGGPRRVVATLDGNVPVGKSGRALDAADRACLGHALELAPEARAVYWIDATAGYSYRFTALRGYSAMGWPCREFMLEITRGKQPVPEVVRGRACRTEDGVWGMAA
jgi:surface antigen